jgi:hypothetical protein
MKEQFRKHRFNSGSIKLLDTCNAIIEDYRGQGLNLTVRQLYYRLVAADTIENTVRSYKKVVNLLNNARLAGYVSWDAIEDRTRNYRKQSTWPCPGSIMHSCISSYNIDKWIDQPTQVEVWVEKEALIGVIGQICDELEIPYFACRGYVSQSEQWRAAKRCEERYQDSDQETVILHLGDHDPSGMDMTRDNQDRLLELSWDSPVEVRRIALNMDQVRKYSPPPNPAKMTDSRIGNYMSQFGSSSWELDALEPRVLQNLIRDESEGLIDRELWDARVLIQEEERGLLRKAKNFIDEES